MHHGMLGAADVHIDGQPVGYLLLVEGFLAVVWIGKSQVIPSRASERTHGVGLALAFWSVHELRNRGQRRFTRVRGLIVLYIGKCHRKLSRFLSIGRMNDRDRRSPIALAADAPIAQLVVDALPPFP